ncbi:DMT family transporter [Latilactobacillus sakei]|uniref:DMT family transporter n=1 Tax=Latilactobacillus sakei TaxID=1599 RepID=UPI000C13D4FB|nr:DMT family transporter [Latilactobacillus sakei]RXA82404.1 EamA family transporter [Latilactobacillus sakei]UNC21348.1 EamA family transporter [Latilactobacillus sakei]UNC23195.1 EamA family transporter [Latilactobacillus sakei]SOB39231.1 Transport protein [Latilactobacillus sakei]
MIQQRRKGIYLAILGSIFWGIQGPVSQWLFTDTPIAPEWLMGVKMGLSGLFLLGYAFSKQPKTVTAVWRQPRDAGRLLAFAILGLSAVQYAYFLTIQASNAPTTTILQQLGTVMIIIISLVIYHKTPSRTELIAVIVALLGTWLLVTKGQLTQLSISGAALGLGLCLGFSGALNTLIPGKLFQKYDTLVIVAWAMLIGGVLFNVIHPFWVDAPPMNMPTIISVLFIAIFGTALANLCFLGSLNYITPTTAGLLNTFEPLAATIGTVLFLKTSFTHWEVIGGLLVISTVFILSFGNRRGISKK